MSIGYAKYSDNASQINLVQPANRVWHHKCILMTMCELMNLKNNQHNPNDTLVSGQDECEVQTVSFSDLAQGAREVLVEHQGMVYHLRLTRNGKLILNK